MFNSRKEVIEKIKWNGPDGRVELSTADAGFFAGMKRKDFFNSQDDWESILVPGVSLRTWSISGRIAGVEALVNGEWLSVWYTGNNFDTRKQREESDKAYNDFIEKEGQGIAFWIDEGKTLEEINDLISDDHTGFTYGAALAAGIENAANRKYAKSIQAKHNAKYGNEDSEGVLNPALMTIEV